jgi:hypothetical protein
VGESVFVRARSMPGQCVRDLVRGGTLSEFT